MTSTGTQRWVLVKMVGGARYSFTLAVGSEQEALAELALFRRDPEAYAGQHAAAAQPGAASASSPALLTSAVVNAVAKRLEEAGRSAGHIKDVKRYPPPPAQLLGRPRALARRQFNRPIAAFQLTQAKLADMLERIVLAQGLGLHLLRLKDEGQASATLVSLAKRANVRAALETAREARSIFGASGITDDTPPIRHLLNLESVYTYEGTHEVHTLVLGRAITGIDAMG